LENAQDFDTHFGSYPQPNRIGLVLARGVFTAGLEWVALALASGATLHVKIPQGLEKSISAWLSVFKDSGFPITYDTERSLPEVDLLWVFGDDQSIQRIQQQSVYGACEAYGHRFSIGIATDSQEDAIAVATDIIMYDTRGCMAPVAIFCTGDGQLFSERLFEQLRHHQLQRPIGETDPYLGPEVRRRIGLTLQKP
jgi:hypothetical protein